MSYVAVRLLASGLNHLATEHHILRTRGQLNGERAPSTFLAISAMTSVRVHSKPLIKQIAYSAAGAATGQLRDHGILPIKFGLANSCLLARLNFLIVYPRPDELQVGQC